MSHRTPRRRSRPRRDVSGQSAALADAALVEIGRMLASKTRWYGHHLVAADKF
jgi:hypothetical protein